MRSESAGTSLAPAATELHSRSARARARERPLLDGADARSREQREGDDRDLPEVDLIELADAGVRIEPAFDRAKADRQTVDGAGFDQRDELARARHFRDQPAARVQAAIIFAQLEPDADRLGGIVLEQHRDAAHAAQLSEAANAPGITMSRAWSISPNRLA